MKNVAVYTTGRDETTRLMVAFAEGLGKLVHIGVRLERIEDYVAHGLSVPAPDLVVMLGILRGTGELYKECRRKGVPFIYIDHAYFKAGYENGWLRATRNGHCVNSLGKAAPERWNAFFANDYPLEDWRGGSGRNVLVLPPTGAIEWFFNAHGWLDETVREIEACTERPVVVRGKPLDSRVDEDGNFLGLVENAQSSSTPLGEDLKDAYCVVAFNSTATIAATLAGIPVITAAPNCCRPISFRFEDLETDALSDEPDRLALFHWLAHNQFNYDELMSEKAWLKLSV